MQTLIPAEPCSSVYGPVKSWRYGQSLGIDPLGAISTCSFDCVYCQLGEIQRKTSDRQIFVPTQQILEDLLSFAPWSVDAITLSGSGEPTLALNLGEILLAVKALTQRPVGVLTNGTLLTDSQVRQELFLADQVALKIDAVDRRRFVGVNRPVNHPELESLWEGMQQFRSQYTGQLSVQTMLMAPWKEADQQTYIELMRAIAPDEIHLNTPTRPRPLTHQLDARGNHTGNQPYPVQILKSVSAEVLRQMGDRIFAATHTPVRYPTAALSV